MDRRSRRVVLSLVCVITLTGMLAGCAEDEKPTVATATSAPAPAGSDGAVPQDGERQFLACMTAERIDMTGWIPGDTTGRGELYDRNGWGNDPAFQAAMEKCQKHLPAQPAEPAPAEEDVDAQRKFAKCMRDNGVSDFPDPQPGDPPVGLSLSPDRKKIAGLLVRDKSWSMTPTAEAAIEKCRQMLPYGEVRR